MAGRNGVRRPADSDGAGVLRYYAFAAKDAPGERKPVSLKAYGTLFRDPDSRWFMFFYFITFGGFVGLANALPLYFTVQYHTSPAWRRSLLVALIVAFGSASGRSAA